ncbi:MAG: transcriptional repressor LexA [Eubacterium sp.]
MPINDNNLSEIKRFAEEYYFEFNRAPSIREIAANLGIGKSTVQRYMQKLKEIGEIDYDGSRSIRTDAIDKLDSSTVTVGLVGSIACGGPKLAEQNITEYFKLPTALVGYGDFFLLRADGESMIDAGIGNGDLVLVKRQNTADEGQIVVALVENEATLKRFYIDKKNRRFRLHPENETMDDIYVNELIIQGVAVKVLKDLV